MKLHSTSSRVRAALVASLFVLFAAAGAPAFGQATTTTTNEEVPIASSQPNTCNGDVVTFQGTAHVTNSVTTDSSGGFHLKTHVNYQDVSGTGAPSGVSYRVGTTTNETLNDNDGPQSEMTVIQTVKLIAQGVTPNFFLKLVFHITVNSNGQTTSTVDETSIECRGQR